MTAVYVGDGYAGPVVYVERDSGLFDVLATDGDRWQTLHLPDAAVELLDPDQGRNALLDQVTAALAEVPMSKTARGKVDAALDGLRGEES